MVETPQILKIIKMENFLMIEIKIILDLQAIIRITKIKINLKVWIQITISKQ